MSGHAVAILVESADGLPLIRDPKKPAPVYWKIPGGRGEEGESEEETAVRELEEEVGLKVVPTNLRMIHREDRGSHVFVLFGTQVRDLSELKKRGDEGEEIAIFTLPEISGMDGFFPPHRKVLAENGLL